MSDNELKRRDILKAAPLILSAAMLTSSTASAELKDVPASKSCGGSVHPDTCCVGLVIGEVTTMCLLSGSKKVLLEENFVTSAENFQQRFTTDQKLQIALQLRPESAWVSELLTQLGHNVIVIPTTVSGKHLPLAANS